MMKILHIHLFKNAGTSLINFFEKQIGKSYCLDLEHELGKFNVFVEKDELMQCAEKYPEKLFFTAHNIEPIFDSKFLNLMPLRNPISRAISVYEYEIYQGKNGAQNPGPKKAISSNPDDYFKWRLKKNKNGVICNFHISSIIGLRLCRSRILKKSDIDFAKDKYNKYFFNFIVEEFDKYIERLSNKLEKNGFKPIPQTSIGKFNSLGGNFNPKEAEKKLKDLLTKKTFEEFKERNIADLEFYNHFKENG